MKTFTKFMCAVVLAVFAATQAQAVVTLLDDNFNRPDGSLVPTVPTPGPGSAWISHSGTLGDLLLSSGQAIVQHGVPSEDAHSMFTAQSAGVLTADFDITVNDDTVITAGDSEYFAHFMQDGSFAFLSRLYIVPANNVNNDYTLGISTSSGGFTEMFPTDFTYGNQIHVTLTYDFGTSLSSMKVGATTVTSSVVVPQASLDSFALRQSDSINNETISVDNLVVTIPEPSTIALVGAGLVGLLALRRRRS
jgi:PEP-CTERM motif